MKKARKVYAGVFLGLGALLTLIGMSLGGPVRTVAADETVAANEAVAAAFNHRIDFQMVRSAGAVAANCIPNAHAAVRVASLGPVEVMTVDIGGFHRIEFDFFVIQIPNAPFGWLGIRATSRPMIRERVTSFSWGASTSRHS
jgi:hypothetical protein